MKRRLPFTIICTLALVASVMSSAAGPALAQSVKSASDARIGTWTLNLTKSKYTPGPPPRGEIRTYAAHGQAMDATVEAIGSTGNRVSLAYTASDDGKDYPMTGIPYADAVAVRHNSLNTFDVDTKWKGKVIGTTHGEISPDGKHMTLRSKSVSPTGQTISNVAVYDKR